MPTDISENQAKIQKMTRLDKECLHSYLCLLEYEKSMSKPKQPIEIMIDEATGYSEGKAKEDYLSYIDGFYDGNPPQYMKDILLDLPK